MYVQGREEVGDFDGIGDGEQFIFAVEQAQLAAITRGEFPDGDFGFVFALHVTAPIW